MSGRGPGALLTAVGFRFPALSVGVVEDGGGEVGGDGGGEVGGVFLPSSDTARTLDRVRTGSVVLIEVGPGAGGGGETGGTGVVARLCGAGSAAVPVPVRAA